MARLTAGALQPLEWYEVATTAPDLAQLATFYSDVWGLLQVDEGPDWRRLSGTHQPSGATLLIAGDSPSVHHLTLCAVDNEHLECLVANMTATGHAQLDDLQTRGVDLGAAFIDPDGNRIEVVVVQRNEASSELTAAQKSRVRRLGHVVLATPNVAVMESFYHELGFRLTDRTAPGMSFMRSNSDHHSLAFTPSSSSWLQHVAYDVGGVDDVMIGVAALAAHDMRPIWGPGRHGPGRNVFAYFHDPVGTIIEYYGELEQFSSLDDDLAPTIWGPEHRGDTWGLAGAPPPAFFTPFPDRAGIANYQSGTQS